MVDAAGHDDLVEGCRLLPAVIAVALSCRDRGIFAVALTDKRVIDSAGARREAGDDLDGPHTAREVAQQRRLVARARADLEDFLAV